MHAVSTLKKLAIRRRPVTRSEEQEPPLCKLVKELEIIAGVNVLEEILLEVTLEIDGQEFSPFVRGSWSPIDMLLTTDGSFPKLKTVSVIIDCTCVWGSSAEVIRNTVDAQNFPRLGSKDGIDFRFSVTEDKYCWCIGVCLCRRPEHILA